jgi:hypothetical protein
MEAHHWEDWVLRASKGDVSVYTKDVGLPFSSMKAVAKINKDMKTVYDAIHNLLFERVHPMTLRIW